VLRCTLICVQIGVVKQVAQMTANERAEIARIEDEDCIMYALGRFAKISNPEKS